LKGLSKVGRNHLDSLLDNRLILFGWDKEYLMPPPPPPRPSAHEKYWPDSFSEDEIIEIDSAVMKAK
jgi:hypothetical protein